MQLEIATSVPTNAAAAGSAWLPAEIFLIGMSAYRASGGIHGSSHDRYPGSISAKANVRFGS